MADLDLFYQRNLFPVRVADFVPYAQSSYIIYSPLSHHIVPVDENELSRLKEELEIVKRIKLHPLEKTELAGHQGAKVTVEFIMNGVHFRNTQYVIQIKNNIMLALTVGLEAENFVEQQKVTNEILQTLKIK